MFPQPEQYEKLRRTIDRALEPHRRTVVQSESFQQARQRWERETQSTAETIQKMIRRAYSPKE